MLCFVCFLIEGKKKIWKLIEISTAAQFALPAVTPKFLSYNIKKKTVHLAAFHLTYLRNMDLYKIVFFS